MTSNSPKDEEPWTWEDSVGCVVTVLLVGLVLYLMVSGLLMSLGLY